MACGKPVVSTPIGCAGLGLRDGVDAVVREGWDAFAEGVGELLGSAAARRAIGENARATVENRFSWTAIAECAAESYAAITSSRSGA
jgi:glycosyltransferase involved in cell wall biosynthesis